MQKLLFFDSFCSYMPVVKQSIRIRNVPLKVTILRLLSLQQPISDIVNRNSFIAIFRVPGSGNEHFIATHFQKHKYFYFSKADTI